MSDDFQFIAWMVPAPIMAYACWRDMREHRIPNPLCLSLLVTGLMAHALFHGWSGLLFGLGGAATGFALLIVLWLMRAMGAGDVKYMAGVGAWLGPELTLYGAIVGILIGGVISVAMIVQQRAWQRAATNMGLLLVKMTSARTAFGEFASARDLTSEGKGAVPYAIPLTLGAWCVLFLSQTGWWIA